MRYICPKCRATFDEPGVDHFKGDEWNCCPECGDPDYEYAKECACCGEDFMLNELAGWKVCHECLEAEATEEDFKDFALEDQTIDAFTEFMAERYADKWKQRRLKPFMGGV